MGYVMIITPSAHPKRPRLFRPVTGSRFEALLSLIDRYHTEAQRAAKARAYYAACALIGSALEGSLLAMCTVRKSEVEQHIAALAPDQRPPKAAQDWALNQLIALAAALAWLPARPNKHARRRIGDWIHVVRELRNLVHPGKHIREYPRVRVGSRHWSDAQALFRLANDAPLNLVLADLRMEVRRRGPVPPP